MNAKEYLYQAYLMELQVQSKLQQIEALRSAAEGLNRCIAAERVTHSKNVTVMQDTVQKIMEAEAELNGEIDRLVDLKREIRGTIGQVKNVVYRLILEKRHLSFLKWDQIACDLGYTERWCQIRYREALRVVQGLLEKEEEG